MSFETDKCLVQRPHWDADHLRHLTLQTPSYVAAFARGVAHSCRDYALRGAPPPSQFLSFLVRGRGLVARHLAEKGIDVDAEALFNAMLVHPVDHDMAYRGLTDVRFSISDRRTPWKVFGAFMFRHMFLRGVLNPVAPNLLSTIDEPFYQDLYRDLVKVDPELAEHATACVMY